MAIAFGSISNTTYASRTNTTVTAPTGITNGDVLFAFIISLASLTISAPTGFTQIGTTQTMTDAGSFQLSIRFFKKVAASESGNYTFTHSAGSTQAFIARYSGANGTIDASSITANSSPGTNVATASSITTTAANTMLLYVSNDWGSFSNTLTAPTGFTQRLQVNPLIYMAEKSFPTAGATGTVAHATNSNAGNNDPWSASLFALQPATGGGSTTPQTVTVSGTTAVSASRRAGKVVSAASASAIALIKGVSKIVSANGATLVTVTAMRAFLVTVSAALSAVVAITRQSGKTVSASLTSAAAAQKAIARSFPVIASGAVTVSKGATKTLSATCSLSASIIRSFTKSVTITATVSLGAVVNAVFNLGLPFVARLINPFGGLAMATTANTAASYIAVTPSDSTPLAGPCIALYIGVSGDVTLKQNAGAAAVTFKSVPVGVLGVGAYQVMSTGTTATNMLALY